MFFYIFLLKNFQIMQEPTIKIKIDNKELSKPNFPPLIIVFWGIENWTIEYESNPLTLKPNIDWKKFQLKCKANGNHKFFVYTYDIPKK